MSLHHPFSIRVGLIAAVGRRGQLGLNGRMPWNDSEDLRFFKQMTVGDVILVGSNTYASLPSTVSHNRRVYRASSVISPKETLYALAKMFPDQTIWVAGGEKIYKAYLPFVRFSVITHVDYDGPADTYLPPLWRTKEST